MNDKNARYCKFGVDENVSIWVSFLLYGTIYGNVVLCCVGVIDGDGSTMFVGALWVGFAVKGVEVGIAVG